MDRFEGVETQVLGLSVDSVPCLKAWAESLGGISYPLLSDFYPHGLVAEKYGILRSEGYAERAIFVIDKSGIIRYIDIHDIDKQPDNEVLFGVLEKLDPGRKNVFRYEMPAPQPEPEAEVVMYCTPWCPDCIRSRNFFKERKIDYVEIDITRNRKAAEQVRAWTGGFETTPSYKIKGEVLIGFKKDKLEELLRGSERIGE
jgi:glutaredoxin